MPLDYNLNLNVFMWCLKVVSSEQFASEVELLIVDCTSTRRWTPLFFGIFHSHVVQITLCANLAEIWRPIFQLLGFDGGHGSIFVWLLESVKCIYRQY